MEILQITRKTSQKKTKRSLFAARRYLDVLKLPIHIINKLFNTLFFPILTYCSEVWGIYDKSDHQLRNGKRAACDHGVMDARGRLLSTKEA